MRVPPAARWRFGVPGRERRCFGTACGWQGELGAEGGLGAERRRRRDEGSGGDPLPPPRAAVAEGSSLSEQERAESPLPPSPACGKPSRPDLQERLQPSARSYEVSVSQEGGWHFHCARWGCVAMCSRFHSLSSSTQRRSLSLFQSDPSHPSPPPAAKFSSAALGSPRRGASGPGVPVSACGGTSTRAWASPVPPTCSVSKNAPVNAPQWVWGHAVIAVPHRVPLFRVPRQLLLPAVEPLPNFHNKLTNWGPTLPKTQR